MSFIKNMDLFEKYYKSSTIKNVNTKHTTYAIYRSRCTCFFKWFKSEYDDSYILDEEILENMPDILEHFMSYNMDKGNNSKTINNYLTAMSSLFIWCVKRRLIKSHPFDKKMDRMGKNCGDNRRESYFITEEQLKKIDDEMLMSGNFSYLDRLSWNILLDTAGRCTAVCNIQVKNFDKENGMFTNIKEKRGKIVDLILTDETTEMVNVYISMMELNDDDYLLSRKDNRLPLKGESMRNVVRRAGKIIGIDKLYPHSIRKTRINQIYNKHGLDTAAAYANHEDTKTTKDHYIQAKTSKDLRKTVIGK